MADLSFPTTQTYTPGSDVAVGFQPNQIIWGRSGNNTLLGYQPLTANPDQQRIDFLVGGTPLQPEPTPNVYSNTFILGDWQKPYYANGDSSIFGLNNFALISDFNPGLDTIQLHGTPQDYQLVNTGPGEALLSTQGNTPDVIGYLLGNSNLSLDSNYFNFVGYTPAPGPVLPQTQQLGTPGGFTITPNTATDIFGNVYIAGGTTGSLGGANAGLRDALVTKYDSQGQLLWTKQFGSSSFDTVYGVATDKQGNFYLSGTTEGDLGGTKQASLADAWLAKYDSNGNQQWIQQFGTDTINDALGIAVDDNSNVYLSGLTVKPSQEIAEDNAWVTKYDTNGNRQWFTDIGVSGTYTESYGLTLDKDGNVFTTGWTLGDLAGKNAGLYDGWLGKLDNNGNVNWIKQYGTPNYDWSWGVATDSQGNAYTTGWTLGDLGGKNAGSYDAFLTKYDSQGNQKWIKQLGTFGDDEAFHINIDSQDNIFLTGYTNGNLGGANAGSFDPWVARYDTDGNQKWIQQFGTPNLDQANGLTSDNAGNLYISGITNGSFGDVNSGSFDGWLAKLNAASGNLENFGGAPKLVNTSFLASNKGTHRLADQQEIDFIGNYFQNFLSSTGIEPDGSGLANFLQNPYPNPQAKSVPEPSSGIGLLMFAAFSCIGVMLKGRLKSPIRSRIPIQ